MNVQPKHNLNEYRTRRIAFYVQLKLQHVFHSWSKNTRLFLRHVKGCLEVLIRTELFGNEGSEEEKDSKVLDDWELTLSSFWECSQWQSQCSMQVPLSRIYCSQVVSGLIFKGSPGLALQYLPLHASGQAKSRAVESGINNPLCSCRDVISAFHPPKHHRSSVWPVS